MSNPLDSRSDTVPIDSSFTSLFVSEIVTAQCFSVALVTLLVYHSISTLDEEVKYFWTKSRSVISSVFFANRYIGLLGSITNVVLNLLRENPASCQFAAWVGSLANLVTIVLIDYIPVIRVLALYHKDRKLTIYLNLILILEAGIDLAILIYDLVFADVAIGSLEKGMDICIYGNEPLRTLPSISWGIPMLFGLILLCLALYKAAEYWRMSSNFEGFRLVLVLIRDQFIYYGFVIFCCLLQIIEINVADINPFLSNVLALVGSPALLCVLGNQLLINLKETGEKGANGGTNYIPESVSDMEFT